MKVKVLIDGAEDASITEFIKKCGYGKTLVPCLGEVYKYYEENLNLWKVLQYYGIDIGSADDQKQVQCVFTEHGSDDKHPSARYYKYDRETGVENESIYCFKCNSRKGSLSVLYDVESKKYGKTLIEVFEFIESQFRVGFPRHILLEFDPDKYYTFEEGENDQKAKNILMFKRAVEIRNLKYIDPEKYAQELVHFFKTTT